jgi:cobalamin biosynthesis Mg chelatase CobN
MGHLAIVGLSTTLVATLLIMPVILWFAETYDVDYDRVTDDAGAAYDDDLPAFPEQVDVEDVRVCGDVVDAIEAVARSLVADVVSGASPAAACRRVGLSTAAPVHEVLEYVDAELLEAVERTTEELDNLVHGLEGGHVPPGPSGAPTRGMPELLPTGRNFYSVDMRAVPSPYAWEVGQDLAEGLLETHLDEAGAYPESVGIVVWGTSNMRTKGDDIAEILALLGVEGDGHDERDG